ncbi:V-type proton ATPase-like protein subunit G, partial [Erysiphe pulchra]
MSAQNSAGIQTLLDAEREAQKIVQKDRTKRVKEARDEAKKEIETYKKGKDDELRKYELEHSSGNKKAEEDADNEVTKKIIEIRELGKKGQDKVVQDLLNAVYEVTPI